MGRNGISTLPLTICISSLIILIQVYLNVHHSIKIKQKLYIDSMKKGLSRMHQYNIKFLIILILSNMVIYFVREKPKAPSSFDLKENLSTIKIPVKSLVNLIWRNPPKVCM